MSQDSDPPLVDILNICSIGMQAAWGHVVKVMGVLPSTHQNQRTWTSRIGGSKQGESATAGAMVQKDTWYDPVFQATIPVAKQCAALC